MRKNKSSISKADSYKEIGEFWDTHDLDDYWDETREVEFKVDIQSAKGTRSAAKKSVANKSRRVLTQPQPIEAVEIFCSYAHKDESLRKELAAHLRPLEREGKIKSWHDRLIKPGENWKNRIDKQLETAHIILLLISSDFMASDYCHEIEMRRAMERRDAGEASVIPIILRPCDWETSQFNEPQALPTNALPVTEWPNRDSAFKDVAKGIRAVVDELLGASSSASTSSAGPTATPPHAFIPRPPVIGFVARRDKDGRDIVESLKEKLSPQQNQLVTLSGPGGIGKTTLAAETARELTKEFKSRVVWSSADGRADFALSTLLDDIAAQLGRADLRQLAPDAKEAAVQALVADPPALVVLDNYETIKPDAQQHIEDWFKGAHCSALFTSRPRVGGFGATINVVVEAMSREEAQEFLERVIGQTQDGAQIFSADVRRRIYETAEANPYVMQWVVGQIDAAQEPQAVLDELTHGTGDAATRVFDRSFNLPQLGDDGRATLLALSLFAPSATRDALADVAGFGDDLQRLNEALKNLRALWLIKAIDANSRFAVEGLTRSFASARLSEDARAAEFRQRFVAYFLSYAAAHAQPTPEDYDVLEGERENLLSAIDVASDLRDWQSVQVVAYIVAEPVKGVLSVRGYWDDVIRCNEQATAAAREGNDERAIAGFSTNIAAIRMERGEYEEARQAYQEALVTFKKLGEDKNVAVVLHQLGGLAQDQGDMEESRRLYNESLEIKKRLDDQSGIANTLHQLGRLAEIQGEIEEARQLYNESLKIEKRLGNPNGVALTLHQLGMLAHKEGEIEEARRLYDESLEISKRLGSQSGIAITLHQLGMLAEAEGDIIEAARVMREALIIFEKLKSPNAKKARRNLKRFERESL
ncbi:MAG TPA: tetratricopeptide repeat protein [Pyrinomonadaceae bacterium]|jgi:tetratricopeptide (TPR) repeat protein